MSISSLLKLLMRHRLVVGLAACVSVLGLVAVVLIEPPTYRASAAVVLLNPPAVPVASISGPAVPAKFQNPYVQFGDLSVVVDILVRVTDSKDVVDQLKARGLNGTFEIAANRDFYRGPIVDVAAEASSQRGAIKDTELLVSEIQDQLQTLQNKQGTDPKYFITTGTVVGADRATAVFSGTLRLLIAVGGLGAVLTVGVGLLAESFERQREDRRSRRSARFSQLTLEDLEEPPAQAPEPVVPVSTPASFGRPSGPQLESYRRPPSDAPLASEVRPAEKSRAKAYSPWNSASTIFAEEESRQRD